MNDPLGTLAKAVLLLSVGAVHVVVPQLFVVSIPVGAIAAAYLLYRE